MLKRLKTKLAVLVALSLLPAPLFAAVDGPALAKFNNPQAAKDDVLLPMPCGGQMAFRKIAVPAEGLLGDRRVVVGGSDDRFKVLENPRAEYLAGVFSDAPGKPRYYLIGKYEITQQQYDAVIGKCPDALPPTALPAVSVSWFEAVGFTEKYTEWLLKNAPDKLPKSETSSGFVRLPTEAEWEFAARGGTAVKDADFQEPTFPMKEPLARYVWYQSTQSSGGKLQPIGLLMPNQQGLHDVLGNADEMILDQFRLNKLSRLHGQAGGFVSKGGNFLTSEGDIRSSYRQEIPYFDSNGARRARTLGFRVAVSAVIISTPKRLTDLRAEWDKLPESSTTLADAAGAGDPAAELAQLIKATGDIEVRKRLEVFATVLAANISARNEQQGRAAKGILRLGSFLAVKLRDDNRLLQTLRNLNDGRAKAGMDAEVQKAAAARLQNAEKAMVENLGYYTDSVVNAAQDYPKEVLEQQLAVFVSEMEGQKLAGVGDFAKLYFSHIQEYRAAKKPDRAKWIKDLAGK